MVRGHSIWKVEDLSAVSGLSLQAADDHLSHPLLVPAFWATQHIHILHTTFLASLFLSKSNDHLNSIQNISLECLIIKLIL